MDITNQVQKLDELVSQGAIVEAVKSFFSEDVATTDYGDVKTNKKSEMIQKMEAFTGAIAQVNGITHHGTLLQDNISTSEFTFDFDMQDGSKILWHEIIKRTWNSNGEVEKEQYFKAN